MTSFEKLALIKTAWCDHFDGDRTVGKFKRLKGDGHERFNMLPSENRFEVFSISWQDNTKYPPYPKLSSPRDWTVVQVATDPEGGGVKVVGWFENAEFLGKNLQRTIQGAEDTTYCISAAKAFEIEPAHRPSVNHGGRLGSLQYAWLRGDGHDDKWQDLADQIVKLVERSKPHASSGARLLRSSRRQDRGDTRQFISANVDVDDGGDVSGRVPGCESEAHKALKQWVLANSAQVTGVKKLKGKLEYVFRSLDGADVAVWNSSVFWPIEVKSWKSGEADLMRGVYQCVKYRALAKAMLLDADKADMDVRPILVIEEEDRSVRENLKKAAERHDFKLFIAPRKRK